TEIKNVTCMVKEKELDKEYDHVVEDKTDKVNTEVPTSYTGTIKEIVEKEGSTVKVCNLLGYIETEEKEAAAQTADNKDIEKEVKTENKEETKDQSMASRYSPAVLKLSQKHGIDLNDVTVTGLGVRITRKDTSAYD